MRMRVVEPRSNDVWTWQSQGVSVVFAGRGMVGTRAEAFEQISGEARPVAWARQIHSARVLSAKAGECGEGDALVGRENGLALSIVTADCVPVLLAGPTGIAAAHAGWRGIAAGVVGATVEALGGPPGECRAWIGPAIGPCCYETGQDVADQVVAASHSSSAVPGPAGRPHLDLQAAVRHQLQAAGIHQIQAVPLCTRCDEHLHSYRRDGKRAGRNHAFIWRA